MASPEISDLAYRLGREAEAVCRHYLSAGQRSGKYWQVGNIQNQPGASLYVRLVDTRAGVAGKWTDASTGEHGDLLDIIRLRCRLSRFSDIVDEARAFLALPRQSIVPPTNRIKGALPDAAYRLISASQPLADTLAMEYLHRRKLINLSHTTAVRFHPNCYVRPRSGSGRAAWPAMIAAVTDLDGRVTGAHRTWLNPDTRDKAPIDPPRKAMGHLLGNAVRLGAVDDVLAVGEGIETVLSLRQALPSLPLAAALSAAHLSAFLFPSGLRRLYIAVDRDHAGQRARRALTERAMAVGIEAIPLLPRLGDFNEDLCIFDVDQLRATLVEQVRPEDISRFTRFPNRR